MYSPQVFTKILTLGPHPQILSNSVGDNLGTRIPKSFLENVDVLQSLRISGLMPQHCFFAFLFYS